MEWTDIQDALATEAKVCTYDRAGYGWSDPGPAPRTTERAVAELRTLLQVAHVPPPYVLVGHSFGGFDVRYFAAHFLAEIAGLVLVESSHPSEALALTGGIRNAQHPPFPSNGGVLEESVTIDHFTLARYLNSRRNAIFAQMDELANFKVSAEQALHAGALPAVPLIVLARDPQFGAADVALEARWQAHQRALSHLTTMGELRVVAHTGHQIHRDQPTAVITAIREVVSRSRQRMSQNR